MLLVFGGTQFKEAHRKMFYPRTIFIALGTGVFKTPIGKKVGKMNR
jgi:hypothetical protein